MIQTKQSKNKVTIYIAGDDDEIIEDVLAIGMWAVKSLKPVTLAAIADTIMDECEKLSKKGDSEALKTLLEADVIYSKSRRDKWYDSNP